MGEKRRGDARRHCCVCRGKFTPEPSARKHQKTCGAKCRAVQEAALARERYQADPVMSRRRGRERKQRWREGKAAPAQRRLPAEVAEAVTQVTLEAMSLGGLGTESPVVVDG